MLRILWIVWIGITLTMAGEWRYTVRSPLVGELGTIRLALKKGKGRYRMEGEARTSGLAKMLSGNRKERYLSEGTVQGGRLRFERFLIERESRKKRERIEYRRDSGTQRIVKSKQRWKGGKLEQKKKEPLPYGSSDDLATLYFNDLPPRFPAGASRKYPAAGAEKIGGRVLVSVPSAAEAQKERRKLGVGPEDTIVYLVSPRKLLGKSGRRIVAAFSPDGALHKAYLIAIPIVGEIDVERVK